MKISIIIPVFNEEATVLTLLNAVFEQPVDAEKELVIVESNSTDRTRAIVEEFIRSKQPNPGLKLVLEDRPQGKGHAVRAGLKEATGDIVLIQDGDLEYDVRDYPTLFQPILDGQTDFVLGSRHLSAGSWKIRSFDDNPLRSFVMNVAGLFFHTYFNVLFGTRLTDPTTMYKVFRRSCLNHVTLVANRFDFDFELLGKLIRAGFQPLEVPISYKSRTYQEGKKVRFFRDPLNWIWAISKFRFMPLKRDAVAVEAQALPTISLSDK